MIEITADLYAWLASINMFVSDDTNFKNVPAMNFNINEKGNIVLEEKFQKKIKTGTIFIKLFKTLNNLMNNVYGNIYKDDERMSNIIEDDTPQIKLKNFEIILDIAKNYYGIIPDNNIKTFLVAGDNDSFLELFEKLYQTFTELENKIQKDKKTDMGKISISISPKRDYKLFPNIIDVGIIPKMRLKEDHVDLEELDFTKASRRLPNQTRSVLEFIIILLCRAFTMTAKQAASLLADNKKYLTHLIVKGLGRNINTHMHKDRDRDNNFTPIKHFFQEILSNIEHFIQLIEINSVAYPNQISKNIEMSLSIFKLGLLSKNLEVVYISGRVLTKLAFEFIERNLISSAWDWFVSPGGGLEACILCLRRHNSVDEVIVSILSNFGKFHLYELFALYLKNYLQNEGAYFDFLSDIIEKFSHLKSFIDEFNNNKLKEYFLDYAVECSNSYNINCKVNLISFLSELWINFWIYLEDDQENFLILNTLKKLSRDNNKLVQYTAVTQLFRILAIFAKERNSYAPIIYKTLTFYLIEYNREYRLKDYIISNFSNIFKIIMSIPVGILVEPYIKQINVSLGKTYSINMIDINFFITLSRHPRLNIKDAIIILDVLGKIFFQIDSGIFFNSIIRSVFTMILSRYLMNEVGVEFCFKYCKLLVESYCRLDKKFSEKIYLNSLILNVNPEDNLKKILQYDSPIMGTIDKVGLTSDMQVNLRSNFSLKTTLNVSDFTKSIILTMLLNIVEINNVFINSVIKSIIVCADLRHFFVYHFHNIGLCKVLDYFGNSHDIAHYYNVNNEELDVDKNFEIAIELIYDKAPVNRTNLGENLTKKEKPPMNFTEIKKLKNNKIVLPVIKKTDKLIKYILEGKEQRESVDDVLSLNNNYQLLDLTTEEDRDIIYLKKLIKDYNKFFKYVFNKYSGSIYHPVYGKLFNSIKEISETIAPSEIVKMFKEHQLCTNSNLSNTNTNTLHKKTNLITKDELLFLTGIMASKILKKPNTKSGLNFDEFIELFVQLSYFCFNRPPYYYINYSVPEYLLEMIKLFQNSIQNGNILDKLSDKVDKQSSLAEYLHPDDLMTNAESQICEEINNKLILSDTVKIPEGYKKYLDTDIKNVYTVPDCIRVVLSESKQISIEILDEIIFNTFKTHTLEPLSYVRERYKIRPAAVSKTLLKLKEEREKEEKRILSMKRNYSSATTDYAEGFSTVNNKIKGKNKSDSLNTNTDRNFNVGGVVDTRNSQNRHFISHKGNKKFIESDTDEIIHPSLKQVLSDDRLKKKFTKGIERTQPNNNLMDKTGNTDLNNQEAEESNNKTNILEHINSSDANDVNDSQITKYPTNQYNNPLLTKKDSKSLNQSDRKIKSLNQVQIHKILEEGQKNKEEIVKDKKRKLRNQFIKEEIEKLKEEKTQKEKKRNRNLEEEKKKIEEKIKQKLLSQQIIRDKIKNELEKIKEMRLEEKRKKEEVEKKSKNELIRKKTNFKKSFNIKDYSKVKEELKKISDEKKLEIAKKRLENKFKMDKTEDEKKRFSKYFESEKSAKEDRKKLFLDLNNLMNNEKIKETFFQFDEHFKLLYELYTNKNSGIILSEFQNFCNQYLITNLIIETPQISFIFKKICSKMFTNNFQNREGFILSILYLCAFSLKNFKNFKEENSKIPKSTKNLKNISEDDYDSNNSNKIYPSRIESLKKLPYSLDQGTISQLDENSLKTFIDFLSLKLPFNRAEIINQINSQKSISVKEKNKISKEKEKYLV